MFWLCVGFAGLAGFLAYLWLDTEAQWSAERDEWAKERARLTEVDEARPGTPTLYEAACERARASYREHLTADERAFESSVLSDLEEL